MDAFLTVFTTPPDPNDPVPIYNKAGTIYGATLPFHLLSWIAVLFRLYTRCRIVQAPGWDDLLITISAVFNLSSLIAFYGGYHFGLGKHLYDVDTDDVVSVFKFLYVQHAAYFTCAGFIKLSLLCQYLRLFKKGIIRQLCMVLLVVTSLWTTFWFFQGWFPCFPVSAFWHRSPPSSGKCWGTGFGSTGDAFVSFVVFAASNMTLDTIIFFIPITLYFKPATGQRQVFALLALFLLGSVVLLMSVLRLWTTLRHNRFDAASLDFTWWYPLTMILACLEIDFAMICASIPIFWPLIVKSLPQIFVTQEIRVERHQRLPDSTHTEYELGRTYTCKSSGDSQENLREVQEQIKTDYSDPLILHHVTGKLENSAEIVGQNQKKRRHK